MRERNANDRGIIGSGLDKLIRKAERHLARVDPVMQRLIEKHGHCPLAQRELQPFHMLANSIISQQLSIKAAGAIRQRLTLLIEAPFLPEKFRVIPAEQLCGAGLSRAKVRYIGALADRVCARQLVFDEITSKNDEAVIEMLSECPGIGRWTAEMFLIFGLKRLDVLAVGDAGLTCKQFFCGLAPRPDHPGARRARGRRRAHHQRGHHPRHRGCLQADS